MNENTKLATKPNSQMSVFSDANAFETTLRMAKCLSSSTVVPKDYQGNIGNCMIAIEMSARINTSPMMVMQNLYIVNGRPAWSSQWIIAMINSSGRYKTELQFEFGTEKADGGLSCMAWADDLAGHRVYGPKITMTMAKDEGWTAKNGSKWKTMPNVMIQYRAASFFGRMNCPDMIMGIYSQEEALDIVDSSVNLLVDSSTGELLDIPKQEDPRISQEQRQHMFKFAKEKFGESGQEIIKHELEALGYSSTHGMPESVYNEIMQALETTQPTVPDAEPEPPQEQLPEPPQEQPQEQANE